MTLATLNQYGITAFLLGVFVYFAVAYIKRRGDSSDKRESTKDEHIASRSTSADELIAEMLRQSQVEARKDYLRLERKIDEIRDDFAKMNSINIRLTAELEYSARRDVEFHDRQLPAILKRAAYRDLRIDANRDSINEVRYKLGMPMMGTPAFGVSTGDSIPVPVADERDSGHIISPHEAATKKG